MSGTRPLVVLGMMAKVPVPGVIWQTVHYLLGLRRLGFDPYYVEAHARTPAMLMATPVDDGPALAAGLIHQILRRFGLGDRWAYHDVEGTRACYGMSERALRRLYRDAELLINLHGGTKPRPEHVETGRLVYLETDPVQLQIQLHDGVESTHAFLESHAALFTFAENLGRPGCELPVDERFEFVATRQPVVLDLWEDRGPDEPELFTTVGNWRQPWRAVDYRGERLAWSKDEQWRQFLDLPRRTGQTFELALSGTRHTTVAHLESRGWRVRPALEFGLDVDAYRDYIAGSRAEFTVAKAQNIRLRTGWFSDRSATYLAAGRPVVTQDTAFGEVLPTGEGLFAVSTVEEAEAAVEAVNRDYRRQRRAASEIAREHFCAERVLTDLLSHCGISARRTTMNHEDVRMTPAPAASLPAPSSPLGLHSSVLAIIPHFRCEEWLDDCLESLVVQTRPLDRIVVIDDCSGAPPVRAVEKFPEVTLLETDRNVGPYRIVQQIIEGTDFDAYLFQDADDWSAPERLELLLRSAEDSGAELIGTQEVRVFCDEAEVTPITWPLDVNAQFEEKVTAFPLLHPTSIVSRDLVIRLGGFASGLRFSGDAEFLRRARFVGPVVNIPQHLYYRRIRQGSLTTAPETGLQSPERKRVMEMLWARARENAELVEQGKEPDLAPIATAPPVGLRHLTGPALDVSRAAVPRVVPAPPSVERDGDQPAPVFVVGADRSGATALAWALAQHPAFAGLPDGAWLGDLSKALASVPAPRVADVAVACGGAAAELAAGGRRIVDGAWQHTLEIEGLARLFPKARFIHVVRDVDTAVGVMVEPPLGSAGATGGTQLPQRLRTKLEESEALERWTEACRACHEAERTLGHERVLRLRFEQLIDDPESALRAALAFAGEDYRGECMRPLRGLRARRVLPFAEEARGGVDEHAEARRTARDLSRSLLGRTEADDRELVRNASRAATRGVLSELVPMGATVAVASRGDDELVRVDGRTGLHFPQDGEGRWIGHHPADSDAAIRYLDAVRRRGARFLFIPWTALWWLDHYDGLREHLERHGRRLECDEERGSLYELPPVVSPRMDTPTRVVLVTDHFPKFSETFFASEFTGMRERGWDVHVLTNRSNKDQWPYFPELRDELESRERIHVVRDFDAQLAELRPELVHFGYGALALGRMHADALAGCKVVVSFRGYDINYHRLDEPGAYNEVWARADMLHLVSRDVWRRAVRRGCPESKAHRVISDAVDVSAFAAPERSYDEVGTADRPLRIVSVGRLHWKKGHEYALSAVRMLAERGVAVTYRVAGDGPDRESILFAVHDLGLEDRVELLGARPSADVQRELREADVCLHAAVSEGFCVSVIEAQAMGLPVVCTDADGLAENVADGVTGFVVPRRDAPALTDALARLAADRDLRHRMGSAARERAERGFDISRQLDELDEMYRATLAQGRATERVTSSDHRDRRRLRREAVEALERELTALEERRGALAKQVRGRRVVERVHDVVRATLPEGAEVLVVTRGDDALIDLEGRRAAHFPQAEGGVYAGHHPADSEAAINHLEELRRRGAGYLVLPATSDWWLDHYEDFRKHLGANYAVVHRDNDSCVVWDLTRAPAGVPKPRQGPREAVAA
jgi:glycosyltransferase involved in cell wall biosynthesis